MITNLRYCIAQGTQPYENLALEKCLFDLVEPNECVLYLWQNRQTVVIGRNQNSWQECKVSLLEQEGGHLARRLSGGGAVFHDLGNLNFTFLLQTPQYNLNRQLQVILTALKSLGIQAEKSGRNDITVKGRKCSGNAFYHSQGRSYHHGTLLLNTHLEDLSKYLTVAPEKFQSKGVASVRSRVLNLIECNPQLTTGKMKTALIQAFGQAYGGSPQELSPASLPQKQLTENTAYFSQSSWKHRQEIPFTYQLQHRFPWGDIQLQLAISKGKIQEAQVFSDAMATDFVAPLKALLKNCPFSAPAMIQALEKIPPSAEFLPCMVKDLQELLLVEIC